MSIWLITSVLLAEDKTLLGATVGEVNEKTHAVITPVRLMETAEILALVKAGKTVKAIWPGEETDLWDLMARDSTKISANAISGENVSAELL
jgi:hypothetical protein